MTYCLHEIQHPCAHKYNNIVNNIIVHYTDDVFYYKGFNFNVQYNVLLFIMIEQNWYDGKRTSGVPT